jgi:hypothetical protein
MEHGINRLKDRWRSRRRIDGGLMEDWIRGGRKDRQRKGHLEPREISNPFIAEF